VSGLTGFPLKICSVLRCYAAARSAGQLATLAATGDPAEEQQGALGIQAGGAGFETVLDPLSRQTEDAGELCFLAAVTKAATGLTDQLVPKRRSGSGAERLADPSTWSFWEEQPGRGPHGNGRGFEQTQAQLGRELHLRR
jgi:hypothetical protein